MLHCFSLRCLTDEFVIKIDAKLPVKELIKVTAPKKTEVTQQKDIFEEGFLTGDDDAPISDMTIRDLLAILSKSPVSKKEWLNNLLK